MIGGCSAHNACAVAHGPAADYDAWAADGGEGWRWATLEPCLLRARDALRAAGGAIVSDSCNPAHRVWSMLQDPEATRANVSVISK